MWFKILLGNFPRSKLILCSVPWDTHHVRSHRIARKFPLCTSAFQQKGRCWGRPTQIAGSEPGSEFFSPTAHLLNMSRCGLYCFSQMIGGDSYSACIFWFGWVWFSHTYIIMVNFTRILNIGQLSQHTARQGTELHPLVLQPGMGMAKFLLTHYRADQLSIIL